MYVEPEIIQAGQSLDDRGMLTFCNEFQLAGIKRCYFVSNHRQGFVRAWHGHRVASAFLWPVVGTWRIGAATRTDEGPDRNPPSMHADVKQFVVDATSIVHVPGGWYHGTQNLSMPAVLAVFSTATMEDLKEDDVRCPWDWWNIWKEEPR